MPNKLIAISRNPVQLGFFMSFILICMELVNHYVYQIHLASLILIVSIFIVIPILGFYMFYQLGLKRSRANIFYYYSKVFQVSFLLVFILEIYLHQFADVQLKYRIAEIKVAQMKSNFKNMEEQRNLEIENKEENIRRLYDEVVTNFSWINMGKSYFITVFIIMLYCLFIANIQHKYD